MEQIMTNYVKPELLVLVLVLYFIGAMLKKSNFKDKFIPLLLTVIGIVLCMIYVLATSPLGTTQNILLALFTAIVQGVLVSGLSTYANQIYKQLFTKEE